ncbi:MAG: chemotaxis protein CheA [Oxalobacteraceae bacterium]|nr:chemotaxis protein CheA [Oxalobacteraceae bacterium]
MTIDMSQFFQVFFDETEELLAEKERLLLDVDLANPDKEDLDAIFRTAHSIKGGASTFGFSDMADITHVLESLLDKIRKGEMTLKTEHVDAFLSAKDVLKMQLDGHRNGAEVDLSAVEEIRARLALLSQNTKLHSPSAGTAATDAIQPRATSPGNGKKLRKIHIGLPSMSERDLKSLATELALLGPLGQTPADSQPAVLTLLTEEDTEEIVSICAFMLDPDDLKISEEPVSSNTDTTPSEDDLGYGFFESMAELGMNGNKSSQNRNSEPAPNILDNGCSGTNAGLDEITPEKKHDFKPRDAEKNHVNHESSSIRVSIEKVDQLINLVGELVITQAMIEQRTDVLDPIAHERLLNSVNQLTRNTRDLQEAVMSIRMLPMDYVFSRFPRMVRDLAGKLSKKVEFITHGASTELDKGLIERIVDPLTHLVRNSIDHGIETPDIRLAAGKNETGRLTLSAGHQGGKIVIEVSDDGGGLNREKILAKAKQQGLNIPDVIADADVWQLIFAPGFSTAEIVTDVSGRGVGMDVVKRNISAMGGVVEIRSARGSGTAITISLPLTLAILDGMSIKVGDEVYILPLNFVVESLQPVPGDIKEISGQGSVVRVRGEYLPLISLYQIFAITPRFTDPSQGIIVILETDGQKIGLLIDELIGQQQIVVKNLESNYRKVTGISGATILGDGGVSLILDVSALLLSRQKPGTDSVNYEDRIFS